MKILVLVLGGGESSEREVSLRSAEAVQAAAGLGHTVKRWDPAGRTAAVARQAGEFEAVLPILHGAGGMVAAEWAAVDVGTEYDAGE